MSYVTKFDGSTDKTIQLTGGENPSSIEGYFLGSKDITTDFGPGKLHIFQTSNGTIGVWGKTRLNNLLTSDLRGQMVLAEFTGMVAPHKKGRKPSYGYKVQHDTSNTIDVSSVNLAVQAVSEASDEDYVASSDESEDSNDAAAYVAPIAPKTSASVPDADRKARMQALLKKTSAR